MPAGLLKPVSAVRLLVPVAKLDSTGESSAGINTLSATAETLDEREDRLAFCKTPAPGVVFGRALGQLRHHIHRGSRVRGRPIERLWVVADRLVIVLRFALPASTADQRAAPFGFGQQPPLCSRPREASSLAPTEENVLLLSSAASSDPGAKRGWRLQSRPRNKLNGVRSRTWHRSGLAGNRPRDVFVLPLG